MQIPGFSHVALRPRVTQDVGLRARYGGPDFPLGGPTLPVIFSNGPYSFHEGDLFTPLTGNYVFDPPWELPTQNYFGGGGCVGGWWRQPNVFNPLQFTPEYGLALSNRGYAKSVPDAGLGGLIAGQFSVEPLVDSGGRYAAGGY